MNSIGWYVLNNSFGDPWPLWKYDLLEEDNPSCLLDNLLYMDVIFVFTLYYSFLLSLTLIILIEICWNFVNHFFQKKICEGKYIVSWNIQEYFLLDMKNSNFINYNTSMC